MALGLALARQRGRYVWGPGRHWLRGSLCSSPASPPGAPKCRLTGRGTQVCYLPPRSKQMSSTMLRHPRTGAPLLAGTFLFQVPLPPLIYSTLSPPAPEQESWRHSCQSLLPDLPEWPFPPSNQEKRRKRNTQKPEDLLGIYS